MAEKLCTHCFQEKSAIEIAQAPATAQALVEKMNDTTPRPFNYFSMKEEPRREMDLDAIKKDMEAYDQITNCTECGCLLQQSDNLSMPFGL
ncbi:MAG: hypothetical protein WC011_04020 [Candidatus Paceibacterota bacterium]